MTRNQISEFLECFLPYLEHLELWFGSDNYEDNCSVEDVRPFLCQNSFSKLKYLGLKACEFVDSIAVAAAEAPVLDQLEELDLSGGTLTDAGGKALLKSEKVLQLKRLNLHRHYISETMMGFLAAGEPVEIDVIGAEGEDAERRYVDVAE